MAQANKYDEVFFSKIQQGSRTSASIVVPAILKLVKAHSVLDIGCGTGEWLAEFKENGVKEVMGIDGDYVSKEALQINHTEFQGIDLNIPFDLSKRYDLAISLEVAEHLNPESSESFVKSIIKHSDYVLFSAAIPKQKGTHHVNLRKQSYWASLFNDNGYVALDLLRDEIWYLPVQYWYKQNAILYVKKSVFLSDNDLNKHQPVTDLTKLDRIHPDFTIANLGIKSKFLKRLMFPTYYLHKMLKK